jgi:hypothetical protein
MKRIGIFHATVFVLALGIAVPACGRQGKPDKQEDKAKPGKAEREAKPERQHEEPSSKQGQEPQVKEKQDQRRDASARQQQQDNSGKRQEQDQREQERNSANRRQTNIQQEEKRQQQQDKSNKREQQIAKRQQDQERQQQQHRQDASENDRQESRARQDQQRQQHQDRDDRSPSQEHRQHVAWQSDRAHSWKSEHRTWQQRGGYHGYRVPDDRFRSYYGQDHGFRIHSLPVAFIGGRQRFQYGGYWFGLVDPWPEYWSNDWYDSDDVYVDYYDDGYYLYNRRYPGDRISISFYLN